MSPFQEADGEHIIFAGLKKGSWAIYRGSTPIVLDVGYAHTKDISHDYFFADTTQPRYHIFIEHTHT